MSSTPGVGPRGRVRARRIVPSSGTRGTTVLILATVVLVLIMAVLVGATTGQLSQQVKAVVLLVVLLVLGASLGRPDSLIPVVALFSVVSIRVRVPMLDFEVASSLVVGVVGALLLLGSVSISRLPRWWRRSCGLVLLGLLLAAVFGGISDAQPWGFAFRILVGLIIASAIVSNPSSVRPAVRALVVGGVIITAGLLAQKAGVYLLVGEPYLPDRVDSFFDYYSAAAGFVAMVLPLSWLLVASPSNHRVDRLLGAVGFVASVVGLVVLESRGGIAAAVAGLLVAVLLSGARLRQMVVLGVVAVLSGAALWASTDAAGRTFVLDRLLNTGGVNSGSDAIRFQLQDLGRELVVSHPLGIGYGQFPNFVASSADTVLFHSHSSFIQLPLDMGWVGALGFGALCVVPLVVAVRERLRGAPSIVLAGLCGAIAGVLVQGINDYHFAETGWWWAFAVVLGAAGASSLTGKTLLPGEQGAGPHERGQLVRPGK